jgi:hypothetical protein
MDHIPLVDEQIHDGQRFIDQLREHGFPVTVSCWLRTSEDGQWWLYLVSPVVAEVGLREAFMRTHPIFWGMKPPLALNRLTVTLVSPNEPIGKALTELQRRPWGQCGGHYGYDGVRLGDLSIDGAYLYPPAEAAA